MRKYLLLIAFCLVGCGKSADSVPATLTESDQTADLAQADAQKDAEESQKPQSLVCAYAQAVDADTGFYTTFANRVFQGKIKDTYTTFYRSLSEAMEKSTQTQCDSVELSVSSELSDLQIVSQLSQECHQYCVTSGEKFSKDLGWFAGWHLVKECNEVCTERTVENMNKLVFEVGED